MNLPKAIKILDTEQKCLAFVGATNRREAMKLGKEALESHLKARTPPYPRMPYLLPSETED